jgi:CHAT domain-containing protein
MVREYRLVLEAERFLRLRIGARKNGIKVRLLGPDGSELASLEDRGTSLRPGWLSLVTPAAGDYRLAISARAATGGYLVKIEELRPVAGGDVERVAADRTSAQGRLLLIEETAEAKDRARQRFEAALAAWQSLGDPVGQADALIELTDIESDQAHYESALARCQEALALAEAAGYRFGIAAALRKVGDTYLRLSRIDEALTAYRRALTVWQELGDPAGESATLYGMGLCLDRKGRKDEALDSLNRALSLHRQAGDLAREATTLTAIAGIWLARGETGQALGGLENALRLSRSFGSSRTEAAVLFNLGIAHKLRSELEAALASFEEVLRINRRLGDRDYEPDNLHAIGSLYVDLGDHDKAQDRYREALELCSGRDAVCAARELSSIGWVQYLGGDPQAALESAGRALARSREAGDKQRQAGALYTRGVAFTALGQPGESLAPLAEALTLRQSGGSVLDQAQALLALANARRDLGDSAAAEGGYREALDLVRPVGITLLEAQCLYNWALLDRGVGRLEQALAKVGQAVDKVESLRSRVTAQSLRTSFFASKRPYYELWIELLMRLEEQEPGKGHAAAALAASERARARGLLELLAEAQIDVEGGVDPSLKSRETDLQARQSWLQDKLFRAAPAERAALQQEIGRIDEDLDRLEAEIRRSDPRYAEVRYPNTLELAGMEALLDDKTALLEYFVGKQESFLFVITRSGQGGPSGLTVYKLPGAEILTQRVRALRTAIQGGPRQEGDYIEEATRLYATLLAPAAGLLADKSHLLISPDGSLRLLPFEALLMSRVAGNARFSDFPYVLRRYAVSYVPSASVLSGLRQSRAVSPSGGPPPKEFLAFADPVVEAGAGETPLGITWSRLTRSEGEVRAIAALYPPGDVQLYLREEATKDRVEHDPLLETARRIHFATHGFVTEPPLSLSGLVLTRVSGPAEGALLQVRDIFNLRLNADLVTLSACETGLGREVSGEGVVGMTQAFLYAGARSLLVSFWKVSEASTPRLMESFYHDLGKTGGKAEALQHAKLEMIADAVYAHPFYWAPFLLSGNSQ